MLLIQLVTNVLLIVFVSAAFKSLLHEACGRIVNPILGCSGLLSSGRWDLCEAALEAVLSGAPITEVWSSESGSMLKACDIRHVANKGNLHKVKSRFKRSGRSGNGNGNGNGKRKGGIELEGWGWGSDQEWGSGVSEHRSDNGGDAADSCSVETVEAEAQPQAPCDDGELDLNLTLGLGWGPLKPSLDNSRPAFVL